VTVPVNEFNFTEHFSMLRPLAPSLEILVTNGPAVVHAEISVVAARINRSFFIYSLFLVVMGKPNVGIKRRL
jgi:hypothetical protein